MANVGNGLDINGQDLILGSVFEQDARRRVGVSSF